MIEPISDRFATAATLRTSFQPTELEQASGLVWGYTDRPRRYPAWSRYRRDRDADPRLALELAVLPHLLDGRCTVQFSGGRDSSLILAIAVHVARRDKLPLPVALSVRYPGASASEESEWQHLVTDHLGVALEVITVPERGNELASPLAVSRLLRDGPVMPPPCGVNLARISPAVQGQVVLTGEGGDNVLGAEPISRWVAHLRQRRLPRGDYARQMIEDVSPRPLRRVLAARRLAASALAPWLRPEAARQVTNDGAEEVCEATWDWRRSTWNYLNLRVCQGYEVMDEVARREGFVLAHPLLDEGFLTALCRLAGPLGFAHRTAIMRMLAADLLPDAVLSRSAKATFNEVYAGDAVRDFARVWDGSGVNLELVHREELRAAWLAPMIPAMALAPLQHALLSAVRGGWKPAPVAAR